MKAKYLICEAKQGDDIDPKQYAMDNVQPSQAAQIANSARRAARLIKLYDKLSPGLSPDEAIGDMIADIGHYCDANDIDFQSRIDMAVTHYTEEKEEAELEKGE